tara:strand:- start:1013 stop:1807 length:795 start_codon:yes stop_codon:yes gene_type:complete
MVLQKIYILSFPNKSVANVLDRLNVSLYNLSSGMLRVVSPKARRTHLLNLLENLRIELNDVNIPADTRQELNTEFNDYERMIKRGKDLTDRDKIRFASLSVSLKLLEKRIELIITRNRKNIPKEKQTELVALAQEIVRAASSVVRKHSGGLWGRKKNILSLIHHLRHLSLLVDHLLLPAKDVTNITGKLQKTEDDLLLWYRRWFNNDLEGVIDKLNSDLPYLLDMSKRGINHYFGSSWSKIPGRQKAQVQAIAKEIETSASFLT